MPRTYCGSGLDGPRTGTVGLIGKPEVSVMLVYEGIRFISTFRLDWTKIYRSHILRDLDLRPTADELSPNISYLGL